MRTIQNPQVFPPHKQLSVEFLAAAESLSRAWATIFPVRAVSLGQMSLPTTHSKTISPGVSAAAGRPDSPNQLVVHDGHGNGPLQTTNQTTRKQLETTK
jgi:hypothetical protein